MPDCINRTLVGEPVRVRERERVRVAVDDGAGDRVLVGELLAAGVGLPVGPGVRDRVGATVRDCGGVAETLAEPVCDGVSDTDGEGLVLGELLPVDDALELGVPDSLTESVLVELADSVVVPVAVKEAVGLQVVLGVAVELGVTDAVGVPVAVRVALGVTEGLGVTGAVGEALELRVATEHAASLNAYMPASVPTYRSPWGEMAADEWISVPIAYLHTSAPVRPFTAYIPLLNEPK